MISSVERLKRTLHQAQHSYTTARAAVFQAVELNGPLSMHRLCTQLQQSVDRASVYRTVALFEKLGIIRRVQIGWKYQLELAEQFSGHHHHLECNVCGKIVDFNEDASLTKSLHAIAEYHGMWLKSHDIALQGVCHDCETSLK